MIPAIGPVGSTSIFPKKVHEKGKGKNQPKANCGEMEKRGDETFDDDEAEMVGNFFCDKILTPLGPSPKIETSQRPYKEERRESVGDIY